MTIHHKQISIIFFPYTPTASSLWNFACMFSDYNVTCSLFVTNGKPFWHCHSHVTVHIMNKFISSSHLMLLQFNFKLGKLLTGYWFLCHMRFVLYFVCNKLAHIENVLQVMNHSDITIYMWLSITNRFLFLTLNCFNSTSN